MKRGADQIIVAVRPLTLVPALRCLDLSGNLGSHCNIRKLLQYPHQLDGNNRLAQVFAGGFHIKQLLISLTKDPWLDARDTACMSFDADCAMLWLTVEAVRRPAGRDGV